MKSKSSKSMKTKNKRGNFNKSSYFCYFLLSYVNQKLNFVPFNNLVRNFFIIGNFFFGGGGSFTTLAFAHLQQPPFPGVQWGDSGGGGGSSGEGSKGANVRENEGQQTGKR